MNAEEWLEDRLEEAKTIVEKWISPFGEKFFLIHTKKGRTITE